jgi:RNA polymerase sigma factor (sigma-70 family)
MDASAHMDDAALVKLAQGSPQAFDPLYQRYRHPVLAFCYRQLGDRDEAEDVASAAFVSALRGLPQFQDRGNSFRAWLFRIVRNEIGMYRRKAIRHPEESLEIAEERVDPARSPEELALLADGQLRLSALLSVLTPSERIAIELNLSDLKTSEIAEVLEISELAVRTRISRALAKLRAAFQQVDSVEESDDDVS